MIKDSEVEAALAYMAKTDESYGALRGRYKALEHRLKTARSMGVSDPFNARQNIHGGARYLRILANRFKGDLVLTVAAYNAGEGAVHKYNGIPPYKETQRYVRRVLKHYYAYRAESVP